MLYSRMAAEETLTERVRAALNRLKDEKRIKLTAVAKRLGVGQSNISHMLADEGRTITLDALEAFCELAQVPAGEIVAAPGSGFLELNSTEQAVIRALRLWPHSVTGCLVDFLAFFADEPPAVSQTRSHHELWRQMDQRQRDLTHAYATLIKEGTLTPVMLEQVAARTIREAAALPEPPTDPPPRRRQS